MKEINQSDEQEMNMSDFELIKNALNLQQEV